VPIGLHAGLLLRGNSVERESLINRAETLFPTSVTSDQEERDAISLEARN